MYNIYIYTLYVLLLCLLIIMCLLLLYNHVARRCTPHWSIWDVNLVVRQPPPDRRAHFLECPGFGLPSGVIRQHWNDAEKISMAPAQG